MSLETELREQPETLARLLDAGRPAAQAAARLVHDTQPGFVLVAARGTSDNAARYAQYLWSERGRLAVGLAAPSLFGPLASPPDLQAALAVGISQSGASPDLVAVLAEGHRQGRPTIAITNEPDSPLAREADQTLELHAGPELAVAATKTFTAQLATVAMVATALDPRAGDDDALAAIPDAVAAALATAPVIEEVAQRWADEDRVVVLGRGTDMAVAHEWALKIQELAYVLTQPASPADFAHGPRAVVEPGFPVLAVLTRDRLMDDEIVMLGELRQLGARTLVLTDDPGAVAEVADDVLEVPGGLPSWLAPIPAAVVAQQWCVAVTRARGLDPDAPRALSKVTRTR